MPKEVTAYLAADGSLHQNKCDAATRDIELLIASSPLSENQPYCRKVLEWLTDDPDTITDALREFQAACPKAVEAKPSPESNEGPGVVDSGDMSDIVYEGASHGD